MNYGPDLEGTRITDAKAFARDVARALNAEDDLGATPIHRLFDAAFVQAIEDGSMAVEVVGEDK